MPIKTPPINDLPNTLMSDAIRNEASMDYRNRIPAAIDAGIEATLKALTEYRPGWNEFVNVLVNRIGKFKSRNMVWDNKLAMFKMGLLEYGDTIEEVQIGLIAARVYDSDRDYMERELFGKHLPNIQSNFHTINRQEYYPITINEGVLRRAFLQEGGLSEFVSQMMSVPVTSDNWDEFQLTTSLISKYEDNGGFYHVNVPDNLSFGSTGADARLALRKIRAMSETITFPSTKYNSAHMPSFANSEEQVLITTPEFKAAIDVEALASAFNIDRANINSRIVTVPKEQMGVPGLQAVLTTEDWFVIADTLLETTSQPNAISLGSNFFFHHHEIISCSRFAPAVAFWTGADDEIVTISYVAETIQPVTLKNVEGVTVTEGNRGYVYEAISSVTGTAPELLTLGGVWSLSGNVSNRTKITQTGVLHISPDEPATELLVTYTSLTNNAVGVKLTATATIDVIGEKFPDWPVSN